MKHNKQGFTLIELLVVVLIISILAAVALPQYKLAVLKARFTQAKIMLSALVNAEEVYYLANGSYSPSISALDIDTPQASKEHSSLTSNTRTFEWGQCWVADDEYGARVACTINDGVNLYKYLRHSNIHPNQYQCRAQNIDLSSPQNKICKQGSGLNAPRPNCKSSSSYCDWMWE